MPALDARPSPTLPAMLLGLCALAASCPAAGNALAGESTFDAERAWRHLEAQVAFGPRPAGSAALEQTRAYIEGELKSAGLTPVREPFTASTPVGDIAMVNVYADLQSSATKGADALLIVIGSHYDTKRMNFPFVGANDGASSTAVLLELARVIAAAGRRDVNYRFLFLDGEEATRLEWVDPDNRYGSRHHAEMLKTSGAAKRVKAFVLLDMVGDKDLHLTNDQYSDVWLRNAVYDAARKNGLGRHVGGREEPVKDDHVSFLEIGVPSVDLIDFDYPPWHTQQDTLDKVSKESLAAIGRIVLLALPAIEKH